MRAGTDGDARRKELCTDGHEGVLCQVCQSPQYHYSLRKKRCVECPSGAVIQGTPLAIFVVAIFGLVVLAAVAHLIRDHTDVVIHVATAFIKDQGEGESAAASNGKSGLSRASLAWKRSDV